MRSRTVEHWRMNQTCSHWKNEWIGVSKLLWEETERYVRKTGEWDGMDGCRKILSVNEQGQPERRARWTAELGRKAGI